MSVVSSIIDLSNKESDKTLMTILNSEIMSVSISTDCQCEDEDGTPQTECYGDCYEWQKDDVFHLLGEWQLLNSIDESDPIFIQVDRLGWQNTSAYKWTTMLELDGALAINGDFRIEWTLDIPSKTLTARRWSHDEPTGTGVFTFTAYKPCDKCGEPIDKDIHAEELGMCVECSNAYFSHEGE
jgi:hypothetical protein